MALTSRNRWPNRNLRTGSLISQSLAVPSKVAKGMIGYLSFPDQKAALGGPFNSQRHRLKIFWELQKAFGVRTIVETGTFRGTTTNFFSSVPHVHVYTVESDPWSYGYCLLRFLCKRNVTVLRGDSREQIRRLMKSGKLARPMFFYLDAHGNDDLPLRGELEIILSALPDAIVMIDDFQVEGDTEYAFDDYGETKRLSLRDLKEIIERFDPEVFFPSLSGKLETGARRGSIVLLGRQLCEGTSRFSTLRRYSLERRVTPDAKPPIGRSNSAASGC